MRRRAKHLAAAPLAAVLSMRPPLPPLSDSLLALLQGARAHSLCLRTRTLIMQWRCVWCRTTLHHALFDTVRSQPHTSSLGLPFHRLEQKATLVHTGLRHTLCWCLQWAMFGSFWVNGQCCSATSRWGGSIWVRAHSYLSCSSAMNKPLGAFCSSCSAAACAAIR